MNLNWTEIRSHFIKTDTFIGDPCDNLVAPHVIVIQPTFDKLPVSGPDFYPYSTDAYDRDACALKAILQTIFCARTLTALKEIL